MKIRNKTSSGREIAATGDVVGPDGTVDVPKELAQRLLEQPDVWGKVSASKKATKADDTSEDA